MSGPGADRPQPVVLAADDDEDILELVAFRLERSGYTVLKARDGEEALQVARDALPDLAVLDVMMPKLDGFEVTRRIRADGATKAMLNSITELLAVELGPNIRVNGVAPAVVKTKFASALYEGREEQVRQTYPLKRLGVPEDIGSVVAFLLSDDAGWMTGQTLIIDGGATLTAASE